MELPVGFMLGAGVTLVAGVPLITFGAAREYRAGRSLRELA